MTIISHSSIKLELINLHPHFLFSFSSSKHTPKDLLFDSLLALTVYH